MGAERAAVMSTDPPYLVDYQGGHPPATEENQGGRGQANTGTTTSTTTLGRLLHRLPEHRPGLRARRPRRHLPVLRDHAQRGHLGRLAEGRPARAPGPDLEEEPRRAHYSWFMWDYEPMMSAGARGPCQRTSRQPTQAPSGRSRPGSRMQPARSTRRQARRDDQATDPLPHQARRAHLRALRRLGHGDDRRRGLGRACYALDPPAGRRRRSRPLGGVHRQAGEAGAADGDQQREARRSEAPRRRHLRARGRWTAARARSVDIVAANCTWTASERTICQLHRPRPRTDDGSKRRWVGRKRSSPSRWLASSACSRGSSTDEPAQDGPRRAELHRSHVRRLRRRARRAL